MDPSCTYNLRHVNLHEKLIFAFILPQGWVDGSLLPPRGFYLSVSEASLVSQRKDLCWRPVFYTFRNSNRSVWRKYNIGGLWQFTIAWLPFACCMCKGGFASCHSVLHVYAVCRECQALRHGLGLILMQAHGVGLRLRDNCFSEEWMALEYSPSTGASHQAVHHTDLMTGTLWGETKAINVHSCCTTLLNWLKHNLLAQAYTEEHYPCFSPCFPLSSSHSHFPLFSNLTSHLLSLTYAFPLRVKLEWKAKARCGRWWEEDDWVCSTVDLPVALVGFQDKVYPPTGQDRHGIRPKGGGLVFKDINLVSCIQYTELFKCT